MIIVSRHILSDASLKDPFNSPFVSLSLSLGILCKSRATINHCSCICLMIKFTFIQIFYAYPYGSYNYKMTILMSTIMNITKIELIETCFFYIYFFMKYEYA